jgi:hypothetical protein
MEWANLYATHSLGFQNLESRLQFISVDIAINLGCKIQEII